MAASSVELVKSFLRAQNLEQVGRVAEAAELYETVIADAFDSVGPYDRLIDIYSNQALHRDVVRVVDMALRHVQTYEAKRASYQQIKQAAEAAAARVPKAAPKAPPDDE